MAIGAGVRGLARMTAANRKALASSREEGRAGEGNRRAAAVSTLLTDGNAGSDKAEGVPAGPSWVDSEGGWSSVKWSENKPRNKRGDTDDVLLFPAIGQDPGLGWRERMRSTGDRCKPKGARRQGQGSWCKTAAGRDLSMIM